MKDPSKVTLTLTEKHARRLLLGIIMNATHQLPEDLRNASDALRASLTRSLKEYDRKKETTR